jgi:threonine synthase
MDIQFSYNLERMIYFASGGDGAKVATLMTQIDKQYAQLTIEEGVQLDDQLLEEIQKHFLSCRITDVETLHAIQEVYETYGMVVCPHSAVGIAAGMHYYPHECQEHPTISILTAHPAKFAGTIEKALHFVPEAIMKRVAPLYTLPQHFEVLTKENQQWKEEWVKILKQAVTTKAKK